MRMAETNRIWLVGLHNAFIVDITALIQALSGNFHAHNEDLK